jgi:predicted phosphodiesterase
MGAVSHPRLRAIALAVLLPVVIAAADSGAFRFVILGDRTGEAQKGVWEQVWRQAAAERPAFLITTGDTIQGLDNGAAQREWEEAERIRKPYSRLPLYLVPGNHDIWSALSERLYLEHARHPLHYSFDYGTAHFTILDNSRSDELSAGEMEFLEEDLKAHAAQPAKFIVTHRPSWIVAAALRNTGFPLHRLAKQYGVQYVIAGHVHQLLRIELDGVTYLSMPSSGGHLRASGSYDDGWFFGYAVVEVRGGAVTFQIRELPAPYGKGRVTSLADWGMLGHR